MFCNQCGSQINDGTVFCPNCGAQQTQAAPQQSQPQYQEQPQYQAQPQYGQQQYYQAPQGQYNPGPRQVGFGEAIKLYFQNYANFNGRASKGEYWWAWLFSTLVNLVAGYIPVVGPLVSLAMIVPSLAICIRRLHDIGKSWVWYLMGLIPLAGWIILLVYFCKDSEGDNQWGPVYRA